MCGSLGAKICIDNTEVCAIMNRRIPSERQDRADESRVSNSLFIEQSL